MSADDTAPLGLLRSIVLGFWPWLAHVRKASDGGVSFKTAAALLHLMGDALDPAVARVGDICGRLYFQTPPSLPPVLWYSPDATPSASATWTVVASSVITPANFSPGTPVAIATGSSKVTCG